jgi:hypothetical protein
MKVYLVTYDCGSKYIETVQVRVDKTTSHIMMICFILKTADYKSKETTLVQRIYFRRS